MFIRMLQMLGFADVKKIAPRLRLDTAKTHCDLATLQAVVTHRYEVLAKYAKSLRTTCAVEMRALRESAVNVDWQALKRWLHIDTSTLPEIEREQRARVLKAS